MLNATYAGVNEVHAMLGFEPFKIKYELCEIILCTVSEGAAGHRYHRDGRTVFLDHALWKNGVSQPDQRYLHPHVTSYESLPTFACQQRSGGRCNPKKPV